MKKTLLTIFVVIASLSFICCDVESIQKIGNIGQSFSDNIISYRKDQTEEQKAVEAKAVEIVSTISSSTTPTQEDVKELVDNILAVDSIELSGTLSEMKDEEGKPVYDTTATDRIVENIIQSLGTTETDGSLQNAMMKIHGKAGQIYEVFPEVKEAADEVQAVIDRISAVASTSPTDLTVKDVVIVTIANQINEDLSELLVAEGSEILSKADEYSQYIDVFETLGVIEHIDFNALIQKATTYLEEK